MLPTRAMVSNGDARSLPRWLEIAAIADLPSRQTTVTQRDTD
jgi:hypothetical protein